VTATSQQPTLTKTIWVSFSVSFFTLISSTLILQPHSRLYHVCPQHPSLCATHDEETQIVKHIRKKKGKSKRMYWWWLIWEMKALSHTYQMRTNMGKKRWWQETGEKAMVAKWPIFNFFLVEDILENLNFMGRGEEVHFTIFRLHNSLKKNANIIGWDSMIFLKSSHENA